MDNNTKKEQEWNEYQEQRESLRDNGAQHTFATLAGFSEAFTKNPERFPVMCIDEGCTGPGTHLAGSGCGLAENVLIEELRAAGVTEFTTHEGCGAWALARPELPNNQAKEKAVIAWGKTIAEKLGVPHRHIASAEMKRPADLHNAFYAIYDTTGSFNREMVPDMGPGFVTSPHYFPSALANIELATNIAFGDHGFGELFDAENPFVLVGIIDANANEAFQEKVLADLSAVQQKFDEGRVLVDIITVSTQPIVR